MYVKKYSRGEPITDLDELISQEFVFFFNKVLHRGFFLSWQLSFIVNQINMGHLSKVIKNKEDKTDGKE